MFNFRKFVLIFLAFITCPANSNEHKMIVLTGGPCAGKSSSLPILEHSLGKYYKIFILDEIATSLISEGITPTKLYGGVKEFQKKIFDTQIEKENDLIKEANEFKKNNPDTKCIIICDRGLLDGLAYMDEQGRDDMLRSHDLTIEKIYNRYDLVIHLRSFANGNGLYCERRGNRWEDQTKAKELDEKLHNLWKYHKNFSEINNINEKKEKRAGFILYKIFRFLNQGMAKRLSY